MTNGVYDFAGGAQLEVVGGSAGFLKRYNESTPSAHINGNDIGSLAALTSGRGQSSTKGGGIA